MSQKLHAICLKASSVALFLLLFQVTGAQKKNTKEYGVAKYTDLDGVVTRNQKLLGNDVVVMLWDDTLEYKRELGNFTARTVAPIASSSKWLTAALVLQFVDEGKLSLDDKVGKYLPIFDKYGKSFITLRHCLSNFTGIDAEKGLFTKSKFSNLEEAMELYAKSEIKTNPGTEFRYNDIGFNIAARVVEVVSKKKFDMIIRQKLFTPLAMRQTTFSNFDGSSPNPASGARSTAEDYINFLQMLLNKGTFKGKKILSEASVEELRKIHTSPELIKYAPKSALGFNYAMGSWVLESEADGKVASVLVGTGHSGMFPLVDFGRGYAWLVIVKEPKEEQKADTYIRIKEVIDEKFAVK
jgi:CubicO group peptidase (beta-lactamase class C family)